jgi:hypothetical protein
MNGKLPEQGARYLERLERLRYWVVLDTRIQDKIPDTRGNRRDTGVLSYLDNVVRSVIRIRPKIGRR